MCLCYFLFPCALFRCKHGRRYKEKEKKLLLLALMCRACVASEIKAFLLVPMPGLRFKKLVLFVALALLLAWLVKLGFLRVFKTYFISVYVKKKK